VIPPDAPDPEATILELDKVWSFVAKKTKQVWIWIALCRKARQVVAYAIGDRSEKTCRRLWETILLPYRASHCFDFILGSVSGGDPRRIAHGGRMRKQVRRCALERWNHTI